MLCSDLWVELPCRDADGRVIHLMSKGGNNSGTGSGARDMLDMRWLGHSSSIKDRWGESQSKVVVLTLPYSSSPYINLIGVLICSINDDPKRSYGNCQVGLFPF